MYGNKKSPGCLGVSMIVVISLFFISRIFDIYSIDDNKEYHEMIVVFICIALILIIISLINNFKKN
jgi:hypothetical protein